MADVLLLLRDYNIHKKEIFERDDLFIFGELAWPKKAKTNFLIWSNEPGAERKKEYYTLESIMFLLRNVSTSHPQYVKQAVANNVIVVKLPDRKDLLAYLRGEIDTCGSIDKSGPLEMPVPRIFFIL
jgi:parafibromin